MVCASNLSYSRSSSRSQSSLPGGESMTGLWRGSVAHSTAFLLIIGLCFPDAHAYSTGFAAARSVPLSGAGCAKLRMASVSPQPESESEVGKPLEPATPGMRPPYVLTGYPRPMWRGRMMQWLHYSRAWYMLSALYVLFAWFPRTLSPFELSLRAVVGLASSANVLISNGYHNPDKRGAHALTPAVETTWLKWDYIGISSVLTSQLWLWSANFGWAASLSLVSIAGGLSTALVAALAAFVVPRKLGHSLVKAVMGVQFVGFLGYMCALATVLGVITGPSAKAVAIFWVYAPGLIFYVLKRPRSPIFGFHELFHTSVSASLTIS